MDLPLYECRMWPHRVRKIGQTEWEVCVSQAIYGDQDRTTVQFHLAVMKAGVVARLSDVVTVPQGADNAVETLEHRLRKILLEVLVWNQAGTDREVVKVWFYTQDGADSEAKGKLALPLRMCLTALKIRPPTPEQEIALQNGLEEILFQWLIDTPSI